MVMVNQVNSEIKEHAKVTHHAYLEGYYDYLDRKFGDTQNSTSIIG